MTPDRRPSRRLRRPSVRWSEPLAELVVLSVLMLAFAIYAPFWGVLLSLLVLWHTTRTGRISLRVAAVVCLALALLGMLAPNTLG